MPIMTFSGSTRKKISWQQLERQRTREKLSSLVLLWSFVLLTSRLEWDSISLNPLKLVIRMYWLSTILLLAIVMEMILLNFSTATVAISGLMVARELVSFFTVLFLIEELKLFLLFTFVLILTFIFLFQPTTPISTIRSLLGMWTKRFFSLLLFNQMMMSYNCRLYPWKFQNLNC